MMDTQLITSAQLSEIKDISDNIDNVRRVDPYILQWQRTRLLPFLGAELYKALCTSPTDARFVQLLFGESGSAKYFFGVHYAIAYGAYALLLQNQDVNVTRSGMVRKTTGYSEHLEDKQVMRLVAAANSLSDFYLIQAENWLNENKALYPEWEEKCNAQKKSPGLRMFTIKKR